MWSPDISNFFERFSTDTGAEIILEDEGKRYILASPYEQEQDHGVLPHVPALYVNSPLEFLLKLSEFDNEDFSVLNMPHNPWFNMSAATIVWKNATAYDTSHPFEFLENMKYMFHDETFYNLDRWHELVRISDELGSLYAVHAFTDNNYESPNELRFAVSAAKTPEQTDILPSVRYGMFPGGRAVIYAVQMPPYSIKLPSGVKEVTKASAKKLMEETLRLAVVSQTTILEVYNNMQSEFSNAFGQIPVEILAQADPIEFAVEYARHIKALASADGFDDHFTWVRGKSKQLRNKSEAMILADTITVLVDDLEVLEHIEDYKQAVEVIDKRQERLTRVNVLLKGSVPQQLRGVPPAAVISVVAAVKMMKGAGVNEILVPTLLPYRSGFNVDHTDELDTKIVNQLVTVLMRVAHEIEGFEIITDIKPESYIIVKLGILKSKGNPFLESLLG